MLLMLRLKITIMATKMMKTRKRLGKALLQQSQHQTMHLFSISKQRINSKNYNKWLKILKKLSEKQSLTDIGVLEQNKKLPPILGRKSAGALR